MPGPPPLRLQPLRIPTGWQVVYNDGLWEIDPRADQIPPGDEAWMLFKQDMLQLRHADRNRLVDVMWVAPADDHPDDADPVQANARLLADGQYRLTVYEGDMRSEPHHRFETRDRHALVAEIERVLEAVLRRAL